jgi:hypothetical protein
MEQAMSQAKRDSITMGLSENEMEFVKFIREARELICLEEQEGRSEPPLTFTITITLSGSEVRVGWEGAGIKGNGTGLSFDEAYGRAYKDHDNKILGCVRSLLRQPRLVQSRM